MSGRLWLLLDLLVTVAIVASLALIARASITIDRIDTSLASAHHVAAGRIVDICATSTGAEYWLEEVETPFWRSLLAIPKK